MASLTRCDSCSKEYVPGHRLEALRVERTTDVRRMCDKPEWDLCSIECLADLGRALLAEQRPSA